MPHANKSPFSVRSSVRLIQKSLPAPCETSPFLNRGTLSSNFPKHQYPHSECLLSNALLYSEYLPLLAYQYNVGYLNCNHSSGRQFQSSTPYGCTSVLPLPQQTHPSSYECLAHANG